MATTLSKIHTRHHRRPRRRQCCENGRHGNAALVECGKPFSFLYCIFSSSIFIPSLVPSQSKKLPPGRQRGCVRQKHVFAFLSLSLLNPTQPNPTPSRRWDAAAKMGFHSFIFRIIVRLFADFTFTADNGGGFVCGSACSTHDKNFTLCHLPSCLHKCTRTCLHTVGC